jgi:tRNase Z endonuclease
VIQQNLHDSDSNTKISFRFTSLLEHGCMSKRLLAVRSTSRFPLLARTGICHSAQLPRASVSISTKQNYRRRPSPLNSELFSIRQTRMTTRTSKNPLSSITITFLGTASAQPSSTRNHSALALRLSGDVWLFDCGEATQHQIQRSAVKMGKVEKIFITHTHGKPPLFSSEIQPDSHLSLKATIYSVYFLS